MNKKIVTRGQLTRQQLHSRYNNMINRCYNEKWQDENGIKYRNVAVCDLWLKDKEAYFSWFKANYYTVGDGQMDVDHNILDYTNTVYAPDKCLIVPHDINVMYENLEVGTTNITYNSRSGTYTVKVMDEGEYITDTGFKTYNEALDCYCAIKEWTLWEKADSLKDDIPYKLYNRMLNTNVKEINQKNYLQ